ncbi:AHH domain-containing protein [Rummeliibacillus sp. SL167]|uniref:AHH domain-containing protein n=1 Tax=Rummeliibacillus sp. SL167 TaxID=2579792 RepID=UPI0011B4041E|nr:AHH domain-containing protein [Rummeliibacillus sp. SL167]
MISYALGTLGLFAVGTKGLGAVTKTGMTTVKATAKVGVHKVKGAAQKISPLNLYPYAPQHQLVGVNAGVVPYNTVNSVGLRDQLISMAKMEASGSGTKGSGGSNTRLIPGTEGVVTGGDSTKLGKNMMESMGQKRSTKWTGHQAQHIIPSEMKDHQILQKIGMDFDDASNGLFLRTPAEDVSAMSRHRGYHSTYNEFVKSQLDAIDITQDVNALQRQVLDLQSNLKKLQQSGLPLYPNQGASVDLWQRSLNRIK